MSKTDVILVTGTSSGIGRATALALAQPGRVVFAAMRDLDGRNREQAETLRREAAAHDGDLRPIDLDVTDGVSAARGVEEVLDHAGRVDVLVNNAGRACAGVQEAFPAAQVDALFQVNALGPHRLSREVLPYMRAQGSGLLVLVSASIGRYVMPFMGPYCASKFAAEALAETYRYELAPYGIDSCIVEPGPYPTGLLEKRMQPEDLDCVGEYGDLGQAPAKMVAAMEKMLERDSAPDPAEVGEAVARLVAMPAGERPLRTTVGRNVKPVDTINDAVAPVQEQVMKGMKLEHLLEAGTR